LQQGDRDDQSSAALNLQEDPFEPTQGTKFYANLLPDLQKGPRLIGDPGRYQSSYCLNLCLIDGDWLTINANDLNDTRNLEDWQSILGLETTKEIPGEKRNFYLYSSVRPTPSTLA
jgi:hypothetical protein